MMTAQRVSGGAKDRNQAVRIQAVRELERMISYAKNEGISGNVGLEINVKSGDLMKLKTSVTEFPRVR